ncbi:uncharacterized protein [Littorina saxatilis]|uniref:Uncharacterized protein n=1 Tax=Littorina saxatilis TaxID=31220 RepID=A0AAN9BHY4_9CAEN
MASKAGHFSSDGRNEAETTSPATTLFSLCKQRVQEWYPELYKRVYFIPPVYMNRTEHREMQVSGQTVCVTQAPSRTPARGDEQTLRESDARDDQSQQTVLDCLQRVSKDQTEGMFVLSQLNFGHYLNEPSFAAAAATLPKPGDLQAENKERGDFDVLILHRKYGIFVGEIKSIGDLLSSLTPKEQDQQVKKKVNVAMRQLQKAEDVLQHVMSGDAPRIQKTLMLPNISRLQFQRVLKDSPSLAQDLRGCLGVTGNTDPSTLCLTSDDILNPGKWWHRWLTGMGNDPAMTDAVYLDLVSRFCGPATTVTVHCSSTPRLARAQHSDLRTPGEGVVETASRFAPVDIVLHPSQVAALNKQKRLVFIHGPPGTGKTLVLILKATEWLKQNKPVQIVSMSKYSRAVSEGIVSQLNLAVKPAASHLIKLHTFDLTDEVDRAVESLMKEAAADKLYLIFDEVSGVEQRNLEQKCFTRLCSELQKRCRGLHIWAASLYHGLKPKRLTEVILTEPLRTPPAVTRHVQQQPLMGDGKEIRGYTRSASCQPSEGPAPKIVRHTGRGDHIDGRPRDCEQCGREIGKTIRELDVGGKGARSGDSPHPLRYSDVIILTNLRTLDDADNDPSSSRRGKTSGLLRGLREERIPVKVLKSSDMEGVRDVANMTGPDQVIATDNRVVQGLERKVVVCVGSVSVGDDRMGRLKSASRCTSQLVWVEEVREQTDSSGEDHSG